eukprot:5275816-Pyramimonas_sp.AAC.1
MLQGLSLGQGKLRSLAKVVAHLDPDAPGLSAGDRFLRKGNELADAGAKLAVARHPAFDPSLSQELDWKIKVSKSVMSLGAALLPLWPRVEFLGVERVPRPPAPAVHRLQHQWELISS